jgi:hypothetical protein
VAELSEGELDALIEEATVDAYDEDEQFAGVSEQLADCRAMIEETSGRPVPDHCPGRRRAIGILELPLAAPPPACAECISAYRRWAAP